MKIKSKNYKIKNQNQKKNIIMEFKRLKNKKKEQENKL